VDAEGAGRCWEVAADAGADGDAAADDDLEPRGGGRHADCDSVAIEVERRSYTRARFMASSRCSGCCISTSICSVPPKPAINR